MNKETLIAKRTELEKTFNNVQTKVGELNQELLRLQGEYRLVDSQIKELEALETPAVSVESEGKKK